MTGEVWEHVRWWTDWETMQLLPYGGESLADEPAFVTEVIRECIAARNKALATQAPPVPRPPAR